MVRGAPAEPAPALPACYRNDTQTDKLGSFRIRSKELMTAK